MTIDKDDMKTAVKEAIKEWLNERAAQFGWWSIYGISGLLLTALLYAILHLSGWQLVRPIK